MQNFSCRCGNKLFFENSQCVSCNSEIGWCPQCNTLRALQPEAGGGYRCSVAGCGTALQKCRNYTEHQACNRCVPALPATAGQPELCDYCRFNKTIPDLQVDGNREKWQRIEAAKRRMLYTLDSLGVPYGTAADGCELPLSFDFKGDQEAARLLWFNVNKAEQVFTGHANGKVTINIREADDVEREKNRVSFGESHRTIIGHFRHEMGHYFWDLLVKNKCEAECVSVFGDHNNPDYGSALQIYYENGARPGWESDYVSGYATMHPWEDFAESFAAYLDMFAVVDIAFHARSLQSVDPRQASFAEISEQFAQLGLLVNEMNRAMGLLDLAPEVLTFSILKKIEFVHQLLQQAASMKSNQAGAGMH